MSGTLHDRAAGSGRGDDPRGGGVHGAGTSTPLARLALAVQGGRWKGGEGVGDVEVSGIAADTRAVRPGEVFVAIRGTSTDSHALVGEAVAAGAAAVVAEREVNANGAPLLVVPDSRRALAELAAAWYGRPAERLPLVGITGTLGKTSVLSMLEAMLTRAGRRVGTVGSLGVQIAGVTEETGHTVPPPPVLHRAFAAMLDAGAELAAMEVTTHALSQQRVHGLRFALGIFTNLVPMEHLEFHGSFEAYAAVKAQYFDHLAPGAPVLYSSGDRSVRAMVEERGLRGIGCGGTPDAALYVERRATSPAGSEVVLHVREPLPMPGGGEVTPTEIPLRLRLLGRSNINNAALAAGGALCLGAGAEPIHAALAELSPPRRRMQLVEAGGFTILDDTVGHPDSVTAVFEVAALLPHRRLHVVFAIRGRRGATVNRGDAEALAVWAAQVPVATLTVTRSEEATNAANRVATDEHSAFVEQLRRHDLDFADHARLDDAIAHAVAHVETGDLLLLLGAQGMDRGAETVRRMVG